MKRNNLDFRTLNADEIECKATLAGNRIEISLHSTAATCTKILNETVGSMNWEKEYTSGNKNCIVRIWDEDKGRMISKEDCGGPLTAIDGQKGQASNGFKRVCALGWGLGLELYSQPTIMIPRTDDNTAYDEKSGLYVSESYFVKEIEYNESREITQCVIINSDGHVVYDGPNEKGESNVVPVIEEPKLVIPEDADIQNNPDAQDEELDELPDNTDGFEDVADDFMKQGAPFDAVDYRKEIETEIRRTHVKKSDVLKVLKIDSFDAITGVSEELLDETLRKLRVMKTYSN